MSFNEFQPPSNTKHGTFSCIECGYGIYNYICISGQLSSSRYGDNASETPRFKTSDKKHARGSLNDFIKEIVVEGRAN